MIPSNPLKSQNYEFLNSLTGKEKVGINEKGELIVESKVKGFVKGFFQKDPRIGKIALEYAIDAFRKKEFQDVTGQEAYAHLINRLTTLELISNEQKGMIALAWYTQKSLFLIDQGVKKEVAEAMMTLEMVHDPHIPEDVKSIIRPEPTKGGTSGSYFVKNMSGNVIGVFKPQDEEVFMPNNPKGKAQAYKPEFRLGPRAGHIQGTSWQKEIAAWALDQGQFANVPFTTELSVPFPQIPGSNKILIKKGSFQVFAKGKPIEDLTSTVIESIPVSSAQRVAIFDLSIGNSDRNLGNMLYDSASQVLTPIDHGLVLLDSLNWKEMLQRSEGNCHWLTWPQMKEPLDVEAQKWVMHYDIEKKCQDLRNIGIQEGSIREHRLRMIFLQEAVQQGFSIFEIGQLSMQTHLDMEELTFLDRIMQTTMLDLSEDEKYLEESLFLAHFSQVVRKELKGMKK